MHKIYLYPQCSISFSILTFPILTDTEIVTILLPEKNKLNRNSVVKEENTRVQLIVNIWMTFGREAMG